MYGETNPLTTAREEVLINSFRFISKILGWNSVPECPFPALFNAGFIPVYREYSKGAAYPRDYLPP
jgi:hypothetical protein